MLTSLVNLVVATLTLIWQIVSSPITIILLSIAASIIFFLSGFAFVTVYGVMTLVIVVLGIISIFFSPLRHLVGFIIIVGAIFYLSGKIFPSVENYIAVNFPSYKEWKVTGKQLADTKLAESTISMKKELIASEVNKGTFGSLTADSVAYDEYGAVLKDILLKKGQKIMSLGLKNIPQKEAPGSVGNEGMVLISIPNVNGDFIQSRSVMVPTRKVEWDSQKEKAMEKDSSVEKKEDFSVKISYIPTSKLEIKQVRKSGEVVYHGIKSIVRTKDNLTIMCNDGLTLTGTGFGNGQQYVGRWTQGKGNSGPFMLKFVDENNAPEGTIGQREGDNILTIYPI